MQRVVKMTPRIRKMLEEVSEKSMHPEIRLRAKKYLSIKDPVLAEGAEEIIERVYEGVLMEQIINSVEIDIDNMRVIKTTT